MGFLMACRAFEMPTYIYWEILISTLFNNNSGNVGFVWYVSELNHNLLLPLSGPK
jgi:hypothetical protein